MSSANIQAAAFSNAPNTQNSSKCPCCSRPMRKYNIKRHLQACKEGPKKKFVEQILQKFDKQQKQLNILQSLLVNRVHDEIVSIDIQEATQIVVTSISPLIKQKIKSLGPARSYKTIANDLIEGLSEFLSLHGSEQRKLTTARLIQLKNDPRFRCYRAQFKKILKLKFKCQKIKSTQELEEVLKRLSSKITTRNRYRSLFTKIARNFDFPFPAEHEQATNTELEEEQPNLAALKSSKEYAEQTVSKRAINLKQISEQLSKNCNSVAKSQNSAQRQIQRLTKQIEQENALFQASCEDQGELQEQAELEENYSRQCDFSNQDLSPFCLDEVPEAGRFVSYIYPILINQINPTHLKLLSKIKDQNPTKQKFQSIKLCPMCEIEVKTLEQSKCECGLSIYHIKCKEEEDDGELLCCSDQSWRKLTLSQLKQEFSAHILTIDSNRTVFQVDFVFESIPELEFERGIQEYLKDTKRTYQQGNLFNEGAILLDPFAQIPSYKTQYVLTRYWRQPFPPLKIQYLSGKGYTAIATRDINKHQLICEYTGILEVSKGRVRSEGLLELSRGPFSNMDVVINPDKIGNIGRVLNCRRTKANRAKANCSFVKLIYRNRPHIFIYSIRSIEEGQSVIFVSDGAGKHGHLGSE